VIVVYGRADDPPLTLAVEAACAFGVRHLFVDQARLHQYDVFVEVGSNGISGELIVDGQHVPMDSIDGVYARPLDLSEAWPDELSRLRAETFHRAFVEWLDYGPTLVVSRPRAMESNSSKPYQSQLIAAAGFAVPETLVSSDPDEVREFWMVHGRVVYKSVSGVRSIVRELDDAAATRLEALGALPTQFQQYVPGMDVRVHVVGSETYAAAVASNAVDYRYAGHDGLQAELSTLHLPGDVRERCLTVARALDLPLCGIDLRRTPEGRWVCFEVNPMPAYSYYEAHTGLPISRALVRLLAGASG
jgi:glutathione synthase/RimK-type ligase-like ATP-grasp enzyme